MSDAASRWTWRHRRLRPHSGSPGEQRDPELCGHFITRFVSRPAARFDDMWILVVHFRLCERVHGCVVEAFASVTVRAIHTTEAAAPHKRRNWPAVLRYRGRPLLLEIDGSSWVTRKSIERIRERAAPGRFPHTLLKPSDRHVQCMPQLRQGWQHPAHLHQQRDAWEPRGRKTNTSLGGLGAPQRSDLTAGGRMRRQGRMASTRSRRPGADGPRAPLAVHAALGAG